MFKAIKARDRATLLTRESLGTYLEYNRIFAGPFHLDCIIARLDRQRRGTVMFEDLAKCLVPRDVLEQIELRKRPAGIAAKLRRNQEKRIEQKVMKRVLKHVQSMTSTKAATDSVTNLHSVGRTEKAVSFHQTPGRSMWHATTPEVCRGPNLRVHKTATPAGGFSPLRSCLKTRGTATTTVHGNLATSVYKVPNSS